MGIMDYFRMKNVYGQNPDGGAGAAISQGGDRPPSGILPSRSIFGSSDYHGDDNIDVYPEPHSPGQSALDQYKYSITHPPDTGFEYPKNTNAGLDAALKIAAEPSPLEKNRYYVNGKAYQKQGVITDPKTGQKQYVTDVHEPSFMSQVMRAMPAAASPAVDILNAPGQQAEHDWELRNKGLLAAANIDKSEETNRALAAQRYANAGVIPQREQRLGDQGQQKIDQGNVRLEQAQQKINQNQQKLEHLMSRQDLSDSEKASLADKYKKEQIQLKGDLDKARQETQGSQKLEQIDAKGAIDKDIQELRGTQKTGQIAQTGEEARTTKAVAPGGAGATSQLPSQQKVQQQLKANKGIQDHPEWKNYITTNPNTGMVEVTPPSTSYFSRGPDQPTYDVIIKYLESDNAKPPAKAPTKAATAPTGAVGPSGEVAPPPSSKGAVAPSGGVIKSGSAKPEKGYVKIADADGKIIAQIPAADAAKLNKSKYHVVQ